MRILVGHPLKNPPNYTSEDFMVPVVTGVNLNLDYGFESFFEDNGCCKGLNDFLIYGTSDFVTVCKEVHVRTRRVRLLGLEVPPYLWVCDNFLCSTEILIWDVFMHVGRR
jgi:hypothetical protein